MFPKDAKTIMKLLNTHGNNAKVPYPIAFNLTQKNIEDFQKERTEYHQDKYYKKSEHFNKFLSLLINDTAGKLIPRVISCFENGILFHITWLQDVTLHNKMSHSFYNMKFNCKTNEYKIYIPGHIHKITYYNSEQIGNNFSSPSYATLP